MTCAICWKNLPKKPQTLPCGHEFCKGCIVDLTDHAKSIKLTPSCPICRGPLEEESVKTLWKQATDHERNAKTFLGFGNISSDRSSAAEISLSFLTSESAREYGIAASKLEACLAVLDAEVLTAVSSKETARITQKKVSVLLKLQSVLKSQSTRTQNERRLDLLQTAMQLSVKPLPEAHLEMGKIYRLGWSAQKKPENLQIAIAEFKIILKLAEKSMLTSGVSNAKLLRGKAHFNLAVCYQLAGQLKEAAAEYDLSHKYKCCKDYALAAKCHSLSGNLTKAMDYGKKALKNEESHPSCETHLILLAIYETFFLAEQSGGNLKDTKSYKHAAGIEHYCECLTQAKNLTKDAKQRGEVFVRLEALMRLFPWKREAMRSQFPLVWSMIAARASAITAAAIAATACPNDLPILREASNSFDLAENSSCMTMKGDETGTHHDSSTDSFEMKGINDEEEEHNEEKASDIDVDVHSEDENGMSLSSEEEGQDEDQKELEQEEEILMLKDKEEELSRIYSSS